MPGVSYDDAQWLTFASELDDWLGHAVNTQFEIQTAPNGGYVQYMRLEWGVVAEANVEELKRPQRADAEGVLMNQGWDAPEQNSDYPNFRLAWNTPRDGGFSSEDTEDFVASIVHVLRVVLGVRTPGHLTKESAIQNENPWEWVGLGEDSWPALERLLRQTRNLAAVGDLEIIDLLHLAEGNIQLLDLASIVCDKHVRSREEWDGEMNPVIETLKLGDEVDDDFVAQMGSAFSKAAALARSL